MVLNTQLPVKIKYKKKINCRIKSETSLNELSRTTQLKAFRKVSEE